MASCGTTKTARRARGYAGSIEEVEAAARLHVGGEVELALRLLVVVETPPRRREEDGVRLERRQQACGWRGRAMSDLGTGRRRRHVPPLEGSGRRRRLLGVRRAGPRREGPGAVLLGGRAS